VRTGGVAAALFAIALTGVSATTVAAKSPDRSRDEIVKRALIPSPKNVHGEVRWIRRGDATCLQTLLFTPSLRRGIDVMRKKEMKAWPSGSKGYGDSSRYMTMLDDASKEALRRFDARKDKASKLQTMAIEFTISPKEATFATFMLDVSRSGDAVTVVSMEPFKASSASRAYVAGAMRLQAAASFGSVPKELDEALGKQP
jgi:hypothetical protein